MNKEQHKTFYKLFYPVFKFLYTIIYRPVIKNKEFIPNDGPIIVCCNHIHVLDQMTPIFSTKRMIHYMAKDEYFKGKNAWFFKLSGCISVNREIHDEKAKSKALDVLKNGYALGLFPEGTRNQVSCKEKYVDKLYPLYTDKYSKEEFIQILKDNMVRVSQVDYLEKLKDSKKISEKDYKENLLDANNYLKKLLKKKVITTKEYKDSLLLPLKFGAVSMAQKTGATIIPAAIKGKYKPFKKSLSCTFLKPIKVNQDDDLEKVNALLFKEITDELANS